MTETVVNNLFTPVRLGPNELRNRIVMAPMTRSRAGDGNVPQPIAATYYSQRATAGLIISEATQISPQGVGYPNTPGIHSEEQVEGWRTVVDTVHGKGGKMFLQLWHVGRVSHPSMQPNGELPVAPSAIEPEGDAFTYEGRKPFVTPRELDLDEIPGVIDQYRTASENALQAGFDGVEIHSANGYLLDQFLRDGTNHRTDQYGGSLENRTRLLSEVIETVSGIWGLDRVGVRLSPVNPFNDIHDSNPESTFSYVAERLNSFGLAYLHVVEEDENGASMNESKDFDVKKLRRIFQGTYIANGGYDLNRAKVALAAGDADLVAFGVPFIANPDLVERFEKGAPLNMRDEATSYGGDGRGYTDYPFLGNQ